MKNKILKLVSLVMMGLMMLGNTVIADVGSHVQCMDNDPSYQCVGVQAITSAPTSWKGQPSDIIDHDVSQNNPVTNHWARWDSGDYAGRFGAPNNAVQVVFDLGSEKEFDRLRLYPDSDPWGWKFYGSNDNSSWTLLVDQTPQSPDPNIWTDSFLVSKVSYRYIKFESNGWQGYVKLAEFEVYNSIVASVPEFSTYIYLTTLAFTFAIGYRRLPNLIKNEK